MEDDRVVEISTETAEALESFVGPTARDRAG